MLAFVFIIKKENRVLIGVLPLVQILRQMKGETERERNK
jgi:hypothetical protein